MAHFAARTSEGPDGLVVALTGECDISGREEFAALLLGSVERAATVVVDLGGVRFMDSSGLYGLIAAHRAASRRGGRLYVTNALGTVATVLEVTGVADLLSLPTNLKTA